MNRPNIVLVLSDQHRGDLLGSLGAPVATPNIDRLAATGVSFTSTCCNAPVCGPSRMSLLTGLLPTSTGVLDNRSSLPSSIPTIAHALSAAGYRTVLCGRMHFIGPDQHHGFHERLVGDHGPTDTAFSENSFGIFDGTTGQNPYALQQSGSGVSPVMQYDDEVTRAAIHRIMSHETDSPLFMVVGYYGPHNPYVCEQERYERYRVRLPDLETGVVEHLLETETPSMREWITARDLHTVDTETLNRARAAYYGAVERIDELAGQVFAAADKQFTSESLLKIYTSDHGDMAGENGLFFKSNMREPSVRVPLVFSGVGVAQGRSMPTPVSLLDLAPTLCDLADAPSLPGHQGQSLAGTLGTGSPPIERPVVSMLCDPRSGPSAMVRLGSRKYVHHARTDRHELFDLSRGGETVIESDHTCVHPDCVALASHIPDAWQGTEMDSYMRLQAERAEILRAWRQTAPPQSTTCEDRFHWQADPSLLSLSGWRPMEEL